MLHSKVFEKIDTLQPKLALVAPAWRFSDRLAQAICDAVTLEILRLEPKEAFDQLSGPASGSFRLVLFEAATANQIPDLIDDLRSCGTTCKIAFAYATPEDVLPLRARLASGGLQDKVGFVPLGASLDAVVAIVQSTIAGVPILPVECLPAPDAAEEHVPENGPLTKRERDVLRLASKGGSNKAIAEALGISIHTVKLHMHNAMKKVGAANRIAAINWYRAHCGTPE